MKFKSITVVFFLGILSLITACTEKSDPVKNLDEIRPKSAGKERIKETKESKKLNEEHSKEIKHHNK